MGDFDSQIEAMTNQLERQAERDAERADAKARNAEPAHTPEERARRAAIDERRRGLGLARSRLVSQMDSAGSDRFRDFLAKSLEQIDAEIAALDAEQSD